MTGTASTRRARGGNPRKSAAQAAAQQSDGNLREQNIALQAELVRRATRQQELEKSLLEAKEVAAAARADAEAAQAAAAEAGEEAQNMSRQRLAAVEALLADAESAKADLQKKLDAAVSADQASLAAMAGTIPRPPGSGWSIQIAMKMAVPAKNHPIYNACRRSVRQTVYNCNIDPLSKWNEVSLTKQNMLFQGARELQPILGKYQNDWATKVIAQRFLKGQRRQGVQKGELDPPSTSAKARANALKRGTGGHSNRAKRALQDYQIARCARHDGQPTMDGNGEASASSDFD